MGELYEPLKKGMNSMVYKKSKYCFILVLAFSIFLITNTFAKNIVHQISKDILLKDNGSATITEQWTGTFDEGTEVYIPIDDKSIRVSNFDVAKDGLDYKEALKWNVNDSFENKAYRYGINRTDTGIELCFGISEYGDNTYAFSYDIDPVVKSYDDYDGFNFQFINDSMSTFPTSINIIIHHADEEKVFNTDNTRIWAFGFEGNAHIYEKYAQVYSSIPLIGSNYANVMMRFNKGLFTPNIKVDGSFVSLIEERALEESTYKAALNDEWEAERKRQETLNKIFYAIFVAIFASSIIIPIVSSFRRRRTLKGFYKEVNYFRDIPNGGNIAKTHALNKDFNIWKKKESNFLAALIVKMINDKNLIPVQETSYGLFGKEKIDTNLKVGDEPTDPITKDLYDIIVAAAGSDGILQEKELKAYAKKDPRALVSFVDSIDSKGHTALNKDNCYNKIYGRRLKDLTEKGQEELAEVYGLRKFLNEFTLINERGIKDTVIWENLLIYATLFGIADQVLKELKEVYPDQIAKIDDYTKVVYISNMYYDTLYMSSVRARNAINAASIARMAASGLGGATSIGGGGGFSGGGHGGGTR